MALTLENISFDCADAARVARFWGQVIDRPVDPAASAGFASIGLTAGAGSGAGWLFTRVPEAKTAKNRLHLDLVATDREAEVARLVSLGATRVADVEQSGHRWTVMSDPEGNEFCIAAAT